MEAVLDHLPPELANFLQDPRLVQLATVDARTGGPFVNVISWVLAVAPDRVRLVGDGRTQFIQNLRADGRVALTVLGAGSAWTIYGQAKVIADPAPGAPIPTFVLVEVTGLEVHEAIFFGARLTQVPAWEVTYSAVEAERFDRAVFAAMRSAG
jgi:hypothetical protein